MTRTRLVRILLWALAVLAVSVPVLLLVAGQSDNLCKSCHSMSPFVASRSRSSHASVSCVACHRGPGIAGVADFYSREMFGMVPAALTRSGLGGSEARVSVIGCRAKDCHRSGPPAISTSAGIRIRHTSCAGETACTECHSSVAHASSVRWARGFDMERCVACHTERNASLECETCHDDKVDREQVTSTIWRVTHGSTWQVTHGMGDTDSCATCHHPTYCSRCHGVALPHPADFGTTHGAPAQAARAKCSQCHDRKAFCDDCHGISMPHPASFLPKHSKLAAERHDGACMKCHYESDCDNCHTRHIHPGGTDGTLGGVSMPRVEKAR